MMSEKYLKDDIVANTISYTGGFPYLFDFISYMCTHHNSERHIKRQNDPNETHYRISKMPFDKFITISLGDEGKHYKQDFIEELKKIMKEKPSSNIYDEKNNTIIYTQGVIVTIETKKEKISKKLLGLKNIGITKFEMKTFISIDFYKLLWKDLFIGNYGVSWFLIPTRFHVKMKNAIAEIIAERENPTKYPKVNDELTKIEISNNSVTMYRKLFFYIHLHDNKVSNKLHIDAFDMALYCAPSLLRKRNDKLEQKSWWATRKFVIEGLRVLHYMGVLLIPHRCQISARRCLLSKRK